MTKLLRSPRWATLIGLTLVMLAIAACNNDPPSTAREVIERAADATANVSSVRYSGGVYLASTGSLDAPVPVDPLGHAEGIWTGGTNYCQTQTSYNLDDGRTWKAEIVSRESLALQRTIEPNPTGWLVTVNTHPTSGRPLGSPAYGVDEELADYVTGMTEGTLDGTPVYVVTLFQSTAVPESSNTFDVTMKFYIAKDTFLLLGSEATWEGPDSGQPEWVRIDWRFTDINADLTINFPTTWDVPPIFDFPFSDATPTPPAPPASCLS